MHELLADYYQGEKPRGALIRAYLTEFQTHISGRAPDSQVFSNYFKQGLSYLKGLEMPKENILGVEKQVAFRVGNWPFIGYIDLLLQDKENGNITILDHKSRALKPRSTRQRQTKSDEVLDRYLRQLYLYSIPVEREYRVLPSFLAFNCYRSGSLIREPFSSSAYHAAKEWATQSIESIVHAEDFSPHMDYYFCRYICDVHDSCEYYTMRG